MYLFIKIYMYINIYKSTIILIVLTIKKAQIKEFVLPKLKVSKWVSLKWNDTVS